MIINKGQGYKDKIFILLMCATFLSALLCCNSFEAEKNNHDIFKHGYSPALNWMEFQSFKKMNKSLPYLTVTTSKGVGVYNWVAGKYAVKPSPYCHSIEKFNDSIWHMIDINGDPYREIILPKIWMPGFEEMELKTEALKDSENNVPINFIRDMAEEFTPDFDASDADLNRMFKNVSLTFGVLGKIVRSSGCENTPGNNLSWYKVVKEIIEKTGYPEDTLISEMDGIIEWYSGRSQREMNNAAYIKQVLARYREMDAIASILERDPDCYPEYEAFSKLEKAILEKWIDGMYSEYHYSALPMDVSSGIVGYLDAMTDCLKHQDNLNAPIFHLANPDRHEINFSENLTYLTLSDDDLQIKNLFTDWIKQREKTSTKIMGNRRKKFTRITGNMIEIFNNLTAIERCIQ